jgi:hypothetical protein
MAAGLGGFTGIVRRSGRSFVENGAKNAKNMADYPTKSVGGRPRRECGCAVACLIPRHGNLSPPHTLNAAWCASYKSLGLLRKAGVPFDSAWDCSRPIGDAKR